MDKCIYNRNIMKNKCQEMEEVRIIVILFGLVLIHS